MKVTTTSSPISSSAPVSSARTISSPTGSSDIYSKEEQYAQVLQHVAAQSSGHIYYESALDVLYNALEDIREIHRQHKQAK